MQQMNSSSLLAMPLRQLKRYINAYNLPSKAAIEKDDLVRIILNTRPISNESEIFYRTHRDAHSMRDQNSADNEKSSESPFVQMFNDLFGGGNKTEQQRADRPPSSGQPASTPHDANQQQQRPQRQWQQQQQQQPRWQPPPPPPQRQPASNYYTPPRTEPRPTSYANSPPPQQQQPQPQQQPSSSHNSNSSNTSSTMPSRSPPAARKEDMLSLDDMIASRIDPASLSVRTLKAILRANFVPQSHALEKSELVTRVQRLADERKKELEARRDPSGTHTLSDDLLCRICCDAQQNCVFLDCGHMVTCMDCGKQLVATKNECPICREPILKLVHVFRS